MANKWNINFEGKYYTKVLLIVSPPPHRGHKVYRAHGLLTSHTMSLRCSIYKMIWVRYRQGPLSPGYIQSRIQTVSLAPASPRMFRLQRAIIMEVAECKFGAWRSEAAGASIPPSSDGTIP